MSEALDAPFTLAFVLSTRQENTAGVAKAVFDNWRIDVTTVLDLSSRLVRSGRRAASEYFGRSRFSSRRLLGRLLTCMLSFSNRCFLVVPRTFDH